MGHFRVLAACASILAGLAAAPVLAQETEVSVENGARVANIGGCHDCHTAGFAESGGQLDPETALTGNPVGYRGPWGTTYAANLRITAANHDEDSWVEYMQTLETLPPMPWFNLPHFREDELRSLYQYIASLGAPGEAAPSYVPPDREPTTPFIVMAPPQMPGQ